MLPERTFRGDVARKRALQARLAARSPDDQVRGRSCRGIDDLSCGIASAQLRVRLCAWTTGVAPTMYAQVLEAYAQGSLRVKEHMVHQANLGDMVSVRVLRGQRHVVDLTWLTDVFPPLEYLAQPRARVVRDHINRSVAMDRLHGARW